MFSITRTEEPIFLVFPNALDETQHLSVFVGLNEVKLNLLNAVLHKRKSKAKIN
ncbi:MAG TPA: hypothetical protein VK184_21235 [Nostocaceae cyanobacterium]|nr:hypothetical protein [Nostocaceae cyanobacterium]